MNDSKKPLAGDDEEFGLLCSVCRTRMYATISQIGQSIQCPDCFTDHTITESDARQFHASRFDGSNPAAKPEQGLTPKVRLESDQDDDEYALAPLESAPPPTEQAPATPSAPRKRPDDYVRAPCPVCNWIYVGEPSSVGQPTTCHDCHTVFTIKPRQVAETKQRVVAYDPKIGITAAAPLPEQEGRSDELMSKAHARREKIEREKPQPVRQPFRDGIYTYPFKSRVIQAWLFLPILVFLGLMMASYALSTQGKEQAVGLIVMVGVPPLLATAFFYVGFHMITLLTTTANGYPQPAEWPRFDFGEWFGHALFYWFGAFAAVLPGAIVGIFLSWQGQWVSHAISGLLFHPFVILSMLDANSPVIPYTRHVHRTLKVDPRSWIKFYVAILPTALFLVGTCIATVVWRKTPMGIPLFGFLAIASSIGMTIYFNLLGRLAYVLNDVISLEDEQAALEKELAAVPKRH